MRRKLWILTLLLVLLASDLILANIPGPMPTEQAIYNVEHDPAFISLTSLRFINGTTFNGTYTYFEYSNDPARDFVCVNSIYHMWLHYLNPFHQYTTTTLLFGVEFKGTQRVSTNWYPEYFENLLVQVNPTTGQIYSTTQTSACLLPPPPGIQ